MPKTDRVLALLEALQDRPSSTGPELATKLGVDVRTLRRDIAALRTLGIPVDGERGRGGSYRLRPGYRVPPLMFTTGEAAAVALGLMAARRLGLEADGALAKVRRALPERMRGGVEALQTTLGFTDSVDPSPPDGETLLALADAARRQRKVEASYTDSAGGTTQREFSPYGVVAHAGRWYVPAHDCERQTIRCLRADRAASVHLVSAPGVPAPPDFDAIAFVSRSLARVPWEHEIEVLLHTDVATAAKRFPPTLAELEPAGVGTLMKMRASSLDWAAEVLAGAGCDFTIRCPDELRGALRGLAARLAAA